jgi:hypothetical protein
MFVDGVAIAFAKRVPTDNVGYQTKRKGIAAARVPMPFAVKMMVIRMLGTFFCLLAAD